MHVSLYFPRLILDKTFGFYIFVYFLHGNRGVVKLIVLSLHICMHIMKEKNEITQRVTHGVFNKLKETERKLIKMY